MTKPGEQKQHVPVFVSSTYEDLKEHRKAVRDALHRLETIVRGMEDFGSKTKTPKDECLKAVQSCKVYIGRTSQCGEGWHSNEKTVRFWIPSPRVPKETDARCYAYTTPYTTMIPLCNVY